MATSAPSAASACATPRPTPDAPPVTRATRPERRREEGFREGPDMEGGSGYRNADASVYGVRGAGRLRSCRAGERGLRSSQRLGDTEPREARSVWGGVSTRERSWRLIVTLNVLPGNHPPTPLRWLNASCSRMISCKGPPDLSSAWAIQGPRPFGGAQGGRRGSAPVDSLFISTPQTAAPNRMALPNVARQIEWRVPYFPIRMSGHSSPWW